MKQGINGLKCIFFPGQPVAQAVAFTASIKNVVKMTNIGSQQTICFDSYITNLGNAYDRATGIFRAPTAYVLL